MREREGGSELILTLLEGGTYLIFPLVKLILGPPLPDNYCTVPYFITDKGTSDKDIRNDFTILYVRDPIL